MTNDMTPVDWAKRPIIEKYADFSGRAPRAEYWWYVLAIVVIAVVLTIVEGLIGVKGMVLGIYGPLTCLLGLATIVPSLAVGARRLHDTNRSGWLQLVFYVPYGLMLLVGSMSGGGLGATALAGIIGLIGLVCAVVLIVFLAMPGTPGANRYGPNPYGEGAGGTVAAE
jgi:uncharacterized membrane protein YhaH (DUF805 family)